MTSTGTPFEERDAGLLMVFAKTGEKATESEFNEWYETEHIPLRTSSLPEFLSAARYRVSSSAHSSQTDATPSQAFQANWCAYYTISSNALFTDHRYTDLRANRSAREGELLSRLAVLDRRIYRLIYDSAAEGAIDIMADSRDGIGPAPADLTPQTKETVEASARYAVATSVTPAPSNKAAYDEWYAREHVGMLKKVPGWRRTRRYELVDALINGLQVKPNNGDAVEVPLFLGLHEYDTPNFEQTPEYKAALDTPWRTQVIEGGIERRERRVMELYRAFNPDSAIEAARTGGLQ